MLSIERDGLLPYNHVKLKKKEESRASSHRSSMPTLAPLQLTSTTTTTRGVSITMLGAMGGRILTDSALFAPLSTANLLGSTPTYLPTTPPTP